MVLCSLDFSVLVIRIKVKRAWYKKKATYVTRLSTTQRRRNRAIYCMYKFDLVKNGTWYLSIMSRNDMLTKLWYTLVLIETLSLLCHWKHSLTISSSIGESKLSSFRSNDRITSRGPHRIKKPHDTSRIVTLQNTKNCERGGAVACISFKITSSNQRQLLRKVTCSCK